MDEATDGVDSPFNATACLAHVQGQSLQQQQQHQRQHQRPRLDQHPHPPLRSKQHQQLPHTPRALAWMTCFPAWLPRPARPMQRHLQLQLEPPATTPQPALMTPLQLLRPWMELCQW